MKSYLSLLFISMLSAFTCHGQFQVTGTSLLKELINKESVARWPQFSYYEWQASSYDRRSVSPTAPGWFANNDFSQYIRTEQRLGHIEHVMLDADGPGAIVRFWLTTTSERNGTLRIYFDNETKPSIEISGYDLMNSKLPLVIAHSSYEPNGKGGSTMYFPLPFAKHCKVTWEEGKSGDTPPRYYQINYRKYAVGTTVKTFNLMDLKSEPESALIQQVEQKLWHPSMQEDGKVSQTSLTINPGQTLSYKLPKGSAEVKYLEIKAASVKGANYAQILRATVLSIAFDRQRTVWCPLGDFSGTGVGGKPLKSWYRIVDKDSTCISTWVMPYKSSATISFLNLNKTLVHISLKVVTKKCKWNASMMYFHTSWKRTLDVPIKKWDSTGASDLNLIEIDGKGVYMGHSLAVFNHMHTWYGEGDQKIWRDHIDFPIEFGTGLEDYYNTSWAPVVLYQTPFANATRADNPDSYGYNTFTRTCNLDRVPFDASFKLDLGMLGWKNGTADFASTVYWYGFSGAKDNCTDVNKQAGYPLP